MFDDSYMVALAARRGLSFEPAPYVRHLFGGRKTFNYSELTEAHFCDEDLMHAVQHMATSDVLDYFASEMGSFPKVEYAISPGCKSVLVAWTNFDMGTAYAAYERRRGGWKKVREFLDKEMYECLSPGAERCEPLWWWPMLRS